MLNINKGRNEKLMQTCKTLWDYAEARVAELEKELAELKEKNK